MLRPKHRLEMADARDCDQEARENRITNQVPAVALESLGLRFWHRRCHAAAEGRAASDAAAEGRAASDAAAGGRWGGAGARDCDEEARESRVRRQVPAVA